MQLGRLQTALDNLGTAIREVESILAEARAEQDPLATHIFLARRRYRSMSDTKGGKRHEREARFGWGKACDLGFRGDLGEWTRLMDAIPRR